MNIKELKNEIEIKEKELNELKRQLDTVCLFETVIIISPQTSIQEFENIKNKIREIIDNSNINKFEELGIKKLAYEVKKNNEGCYISVEFTGTPDVIQDLERFYRINDNVLKFITMRKDGEDYE